MKIENHQVFQKVDHVAQFALENQLKCPDHEPHQTILTPSYMQSLNLRSRLKKVKLPCHYIKSGVVYPSDEYELTQSDWEFLDQSGLLESELKAGFRTLEQCPSQESEQVDPRIVDYWQCRRKDLNRFLTRKALRSNGIALLTGVKRKHIMKLRLMKASSEWSLQLLSLVREREILKLRSLEKQNEKQVAQHLRNCENEFLFVRDGECQNELVCENNPFRGQQPQEIIGEDLICFMNAQYNQIFGRGCKIEWPSNILLVHPKTNALELTINESTIYGTYIRGKEIVMGVNDKCIRIDERRIVQIERSRMESKRLSFDYSHVLWHAQKVVNEKERYVEEIREQEDVRQIKGRIYVEDGGSTLVVERVAVRKRGRPRKMI